VTTIPYAISPVGGVRINDIKVTPLLFQMEIETAEASRRAGKLFLKFDLAQMDDTSRCPWYGPECCLRDPFQARHSHDRSEMETFEITWKSRNADGSISEYKAICALDEAKPVTCESTMTESVWGIIKIEESEPVPAKKGAKKR
jgi:hypothetical protein